MHFQKQAKTGKNRAFSGFSGDLQQVPGKRRKSIYRVNLVTIFDQYRQNNTQNRNIFS